MVGYEYFCQYTLLFRIAREVGVETMKLYIMNFFTLLRTIFYDIKVVPRTTLTV